MGEARKKEGLEMKRFCVLFCMICLILLCAVAYGAEQQAAQTPQVNRETKETIKAKEVKEPKGPAEAEVTLEETLVTATRSEKSVDWAPGDSHVVTKKEIENRNIKSVDEALNMTPGVFNRRGKGLMDTLANITLRGVPNANRTLILRDGMPLNTAYTADVNWGGSIGDIERIEVVEGPFSSLYGGNAMAGVVNIITKMPEKSEFTVKSGYGSSWFRGTAMDDLFKSYISYGNKIADKFSFFVSYGFQTTNGFPTDRTYRSNCPLGYSGCELTTDPKGVARYNIGDKGDNRWWDDSITAKVSYDFSRETKLLLSYGRTRSEYNRDDPHTWLRNPAGVPVYYTNERSYLSGNGGVETNMYSGSFETQIGTVKAKLTAGINEVQKNWYTTPGSTAATTFDGGPGKVSSTPSQNYYTDIQFTVPLPLNNVVTIGGAFRHGNADNKEYNLTNWKDENSRTNLTYKAGGKDYTYSFFLQDEIGILKNLTAYLGVRADIWSASDGYADQVGAVGYPKTFESRSDSAISPKFALVYKPFETTTLRASVGRSFRPPTVYELYRTWTSSTGTTYLANPDLKSETSTSWDIGIEQKLWKGAKAKVTYFENYFDDMVYRKTLSATEQQWINAGGAETKGFVGEIEQKIYWFRLFANATRLTASKITSNPASPESVGKKITYLPEELYNGGVDFRYGPFFAGVNGMYVSKMFRNDDNSDVVSGVYGSQDAYFLLNAKISYNISYGLLKNATVSFAVDNILDKRYFAYYAAPGRSWFGELAIKF
jgi:iron complex outermembrane recepter protein